ncbi:MAG: glutamine--tRNA ligase, partial [Candidatus Cloacimonadota bacterium]|nr:glutamine--tRNA ligase [Candidatus Cloacimonadota bacterium]
LRAKIDMASSNMNMRDPVMYRIKDIEHNRTGDKWCIYPSYDFTHGQSDSIEKITHSLCDISFENHRPLYNWFCQNIEIHNPQQMEFARLNLTYNFMSKRKLKVLVDENIVDGWDDPRLPTISGLRRRGFTPESIRDFADRIGVAKNEGIVEISLLNHCLREDLNKRANRVMVVQEPVKVVITNYPEDKVEYLEAENNPGDENSGKREIPFSREIYIERNDFREKANRKYYRMKPGKEVRLKHAYYLMCNDFKKNEAGEIEEIYCTFDPKTKGGWSDDGRKVKGTLHWVSVEHAIDAQINFFDDLFSIEDPASLKEDENFMDYLNPQSKVILNNCKCEPSLKNATQTDLLQFLRKGYYHLDDDSTSENLIFNQTVALRDKKKKKY